MAFDLPSQPVSFDRDSVLVCTVLTVINDTTAQGDRSVLLGVEARLSEFQVLGDITTITFLDEQGYCMTLAYTCSIIRLKYSAMNCVLHSSRCDVW